MEKKVKLSVGNAITVFFAFYEVDLSAKHLKIPIHSNNLSKCIPSITSFYTAFSSRCDAFPFTLLHMGVSKTTITVITYMWTTDTPPSSNKTLHPEMHAYIGTMHALKCTTLDKTDSHEVRIAWNWRSMNGCWESACYLFCRKLLLLRKNENNLINEPALHHKYISFIFYFHRLCSFITPAVPSHYIPTSAVVMLHTILHKFFLFRANESSTSGRVLSVHCPQQNEEPLIMLALPLRGTLCSFGCTYLRA